MRRAALLAVVLILPVMAQDVTLSVDAGRKAAFKIPRTIYGTFLEPIGNSIYGGLWAQLLVNGFTKLVEKPDPDAGWLQALQKDWAKQVGSRPLPWYAEAKRDQGAYATFLGLALKRSSKDGKGLWRAVAVEARAVAEGVEELRCRALAVGAVLTARSWRWQRCWRAGLAIYSCQQPSPVSPACRTPRSGATWICCPPCSSSR